LVELPDTVQANKLKVPKSFQIPPPPNVAVLWDTMTPVINRKAPLMRMPPPPKAEPSVMVSPEIVTLAAAPIWNTFDWWLPLSVTRLAPGPLIVRFFSILMAPAFKVMVAPGLRLNPMTSPGAASMTACLSEPAPKSAVVVTVKVAADTDKLEPGKRMMDC